MKLIGGFRSPYVRRTAVSLNAMGLKFDHDAVAVWDEPEKVRAHNPVVRVPTLVIDDGEALVESWAIIDWLDEQAGDAKRLTPASGPERRKVMRLTAIALGTIDKAIWAVYEGRFHPKEKVHAPWIEHNDGQVTGGFEYLDGLAKTAGDGWLAGGDRMSQADVTAAVGFSFSTMARPKLGLAERCPNMAAFTKRLEETEPFRKAPLG